MEIKGEEFLKKVKIKQEKEELEEKLTELRQKESEVYSNNQEVIKDDEPYSNNQSEPEFDLNISQNAQAAYENIALDEQPNATTNPDKKRNYLILGLALIILFLITILTFKILFSDDEENKNDGFTNKEVTQEQTSNQLTNSVDSNFQKIMNEKKKREEAINQNRIEENRLESAKLVEENESINDAKLDETIRKVQQKEQEQLSVTQKIIRDIEEKQVEQKPIVVEETKKEVVKTVQKPKETTTTVKNLVKNIESSTPKGYFVQVGAFTKTPSQNYINNIKKANLKYKVYPVEVNGTLYNKVLIGPYSSRAQAKQDVENIKKKLNLSSAFVLKF